MDQLGISVTAGVVLTLLSVFHIVSVAALFVVVTYLFTKVSQQNKVVEEARTISGDVLAKQKALQNATIVNRIVEKYHVVPEKSSVSEEIAKLESEFRDNILGISRKEKEKAKEKLAEQQAASRFNPKDLV